MLRRSDIPQTVLRFTADTMETAFPTSGPLDQEYLKRVKVEVWDLASCHSYQPAGHHAHIRGCIAFPLHKSFNPLIDDGHCRIGPVDCEGVGGSFVLPVCHPVPNHWPPPPIPVVNDAPACATLSSRARPVLVYPAFRIDPAGRLAVRWDKHLHALPRGRYEVRVLVDGLVCGIFEIDKSYVCPIETGGAVSTELAEPPERGPKPEGVSDMFDDIYDWTSTTTCQLGPGDTTVSVKDADVLCGAVLCRQPELVITDGITREVVTFQGCVDGKLQIGRGGANTIQAGAIIRFEWTAANTQAACEGCP